MVTFSVGYGTNVVFGSSVECFSSLSQTFVTLIQATLGEIVIDSFEEDSRWTTVGPVFVAVWAFVMMFVVLTMFVAIIDESFSSVRDDAEKAREEKNKKKKKKKKKKNIVRDNATENDGGDVGGEAGDMMTNVIRRELGKSKFFSKKNILSFVRRRLCCQKDEKNGRGVTTVHPA